MSKGESKSIIKLYKGIFGRIDSGWKSLLYPIEVDIEEMAPAEVKHARQYNTVFWCIFGTLFLLMLSSALSHNVHFRKSKAGRRELQPVSAGPFFKSTLAENILLHTTRNFI